MFFKGAGWLLKGHNGNALNELADTVVRGVEVDLDMYAHINPNVRFENAEQQQQIYLHMYVRALVCMCEHLLFSVCGDLAMRCAGQWSGQLLSHSDSLKR